MPIVHAYALPHPPLAVPGIGDAQKAGIAATLSAFDAVAREIAGLAPDTIIFITPHNVLYADYIHISPGVAARGDFSRFGAAHIGLKAEYDTKLAAEIIRLCEQNGISAGFLGEKNADLDHGVTVPMWFINRHFQSYRMLRISQSGLEPGEHYRLGQMLAAAAGASKIVLIASGDLSHKLSADGPYGFAAEGAEFDGIMREVFASGDFGKLFGVTENLRERAAECGYNSFMVLAGCFDRQAVTARLFSYEGPYGVGYVVAGFAPGAADDSRDFLAQYEKSARLQAAQRREDEDEYLALARQALEYALLQGGEMPLPSALPPELLQNRAGAFVSLHKHGRLRGCIGTIAPTADCLAREIMQNAVSAALRDHRFDAVEARELPFLTYKVDVLRAPEPIDDISQLDVKRYGVIVTQGRRRGLLLPDLDGVDTAEQQVAIARQKAGIAPGTAVELERFEVIRHE